MILGKKRLAVRWFSICLIVLATVALAYLAISNGQAIQYMTWTYDTAGIYPDLFESIRDVADLHPYEGRSIYPPLTYLILWIFSKMVPGDYSAGFAFGEASVTPNGVLVGTMFFLVSTGVVCAMAANKLSLKGIDVVLYSVAFVSSPAYVFMLERGNIVILSLLFLMFFVFNYNSENTVIRNLALLSLAIATGLKLYPVFFGLLLLNKKHKKDAVKAIVYGVALFILPFAGTGGIQNIAKMLQNITDISADTINNAKGFGYGFKVNISNICQAFGEKMKVQSSTTDWIAGVLMLILLCMVIFVVFISRQEWEKAYALCMVLTLIPTFSWIYNEIYLLIPITLLLYERPELKKNTVLPLILMMLIMGEFPYISLFNSLEGYHKISLSTMLGNASMWVLMIYLVAENFGKLKMWSKTKEGM